MISIALLLAALLLGMIPSSVDGQINVEALRSDDPPIGHSGSFGGDFSIRTGNVDFVALDFRARLYSVSDTETRLLVGNGGVGFVDRSRFASSGLLHYRRTYTRVSQYFSPEWYGQVNYDRSQLLTFRVVGGGGARTSFARGEWGNFGAGSALMLEYERLTLPELALHPDETTTIRWSNFLTLRVLPTENLVITSTTYIQPAVGDFGDRRTLENLQIAATITDNLSLTVSFDLRHDTGPPDGISALDTRLRTGVTYTIQ